MDTHVKVLAWLYIVLGALGILGAALIAVVVVGGGLISGDRTAITVTTIVALVIGVFIFVISAPGIVAGFGLLGFKPWARILSLVLGILNLPGFPVGTLVGIYTIWVLLDDETSRLFSSAA